MTTFLTILAAFFLACIPAAYWCGRRSAVEGELEKRWSDGTARPRLKDQAAADAAEMRGPTNSGGGA